MIRKNDELLFVNSIPLNVKDAIFQIKFLIEKNHFESALEIIKSYNIQKDDMEALIGVSNVKEIMKYIKQ